VAIRITKKKILIGIISAILLSLIIAFFMVVFTLPRLPDKIHDLALSSPTEIYSDTGELITDLSNRQNVKLSQISPFFINAILAMEDAEFFSHHGLNKKGLLRAVFDHITTLKRSGGGSSISQQLAKNMFFSFDRSWSRKMKDALLACQLERRYSKQEILEAYCNQIDFSSNSYGIERASQTYFAKHADELTLAEAAFLANIPRSPSHYNPYRNFETARKRQEIVLKRMAKLGYITTDQEKAALAESIDLKRLNLLWGKANYFIDYIKNIVERKYSGDVLSYGGLKIYTTLDTRLQNIAQDAVREGLAELDTRLGYRDYEFASNEERQHYVQSALVAIDPRNGKVKALVGGRDFSVNQFNRAINNNRLPGSAFKPFLYLAAIDLGAYTPASVIVDSAITFEMDGQRWSPQNFDHRYWGPMTVKTALIYSRNIISAKVIDTIGPKAVVQYAHKMGIKSPLNEYHSLALGTSSVSPLELCGAYCPFANGGVQRDPLVLKFIENSQGKVLHEETNESSMVVDPQSIYLVLDMLRGVVDSGTAENVRRMGFTRPAAGKTGTTNDGRDTWFIGFTPELVVTVWVGYDDNRPIKDKRGIELSGAASALPIWVRFMNVALENERYRNFAIPEGIVFTWVDPLTGEQVDENYPNAQEVALKIGTQLPVKNSSHAFSSADSTKPIWLR